MYKRQHDYVQHRLRIAGARSDALFMPESVDAVHLHTNGIPRLINLLCAQALSVAASYKAERVFPYMVDQAAAEICSCALMDVPRAPDDPSGTGFPTSSVTPLLARSFPTSRVIPVPVSYTHLVLGNEALGDGRVAASSNCFGVRPSR